MKRVSTRNCMTHEDQTCQPCGGCSRCQHYHQLREALQAIYSLVGTKSATDALQMVWEMAVENSCSCAGAEGAKQDGYLFHEKICHVHRHRRDLEKVAKIIDELKSK